MNFTSKQIAELCNVSRGTVDRALNNRPGINPITRQKILQTAKELGYRPHYLAQSLVKGETRTLGIVLFDIHNPIFSQLFHAFEAEARKRGYFVYLVLSNRDKEMELNYLNNLLDRKVDGIALLSINNGPEFESILMRTRTPIVTFGNRVSEKFPYVWINDRQASIDAVSYLIELDYHRLIYVSLPLKRKGFENTYVPEQRFEGFLSACKANLNIQYDCVVEKDYLSAISSLLQQSDEKCVIFCSSDIYALEILKWLKTQKIRVPDQVGLMGFDNIDILKYVNPALTTIDYNVDEIGARIADLLLRLVQGEDIPHDTYIAHQIVHGESV